jgi:hypothetical protein
LADADVTEVLCDTREEAIQYVSTVALYQLHKQSPLSIHHILPPPFKALWMEWSDKDSAQSQAAVAEQVCLQK